MEKLLLNAPSMQGEIFIGEGCANDLLPALVQGQTNFVLTDENVYALYRDFFAERFSGAEIFVLPAGEEHKTIFSLQAILERMVKAGLKRTSRLFAVGGGVVGDIGGLAAALYMRGVSCVQVPTTLLAQVDSSVGGKTAVDFCGVKNIVGAFYQPKTVLVDPTFLSTLPQREWKCGLGEVVKYAALSGEIYGKLCAADDLLQPSLLRGLIADCIRHKAGVCERDEKERGERKSLNVGHTTGHALELFYGLSHGESVLYGMKAETKFAIRKGVCEEEYGKTLLSIVDKALSLSPVSAPDFSRVREAAGYAKADKKNGEDKRITMAVAKAENQWTLLSVSEEEYTQMLSEAFV